MAQPISSIVIDIRADTASIRRDMNQLQSAVDSGFSRIETRARSGVDSIERMSASFNRLKSVVGAVGGFLLAERAISAVGEAMARIPQMGVEFANQMETMQVGMAGTLASMATLDGKALSMKDALALSTKLTSQLADDAAKTAASTQELVSGFNAMLGPGLQAKMSIDQIRQLSTVGINAVKSLGLEGSQIVQEMRSILTGNITSDSQLATALGITNKDIAKIKQDGGDLFDYLMKRLQGFAESSDYYSKTMVGLMDASKEMVSKAAAEGMEPLREAAKGWLTDFNESLSNDAQRRQFVESLREISGGMVSVVRFAGEAGRALYEYRGVIELVVGSLVAWKAAQLASVAIPAIGKTLAQPAVSLGKFVGAQYHAQDVKADAIAEANAAGLAERRAQADRAAALAELERARATSARTAQTVLSLQADREKLALDAALTQGAVRQIEQSGSLATAKAMVAEADMAAKAAALELSAAEQARSAQTVGSVAAYERLQLAQAASAKAAADLAAAKAIEAVEQDRLSQAQSRALAMANALTEADARLAAAEAAAAEAASAQTAAVGRAAVAAEAASVAQRQLAVATQQASVASQAAAVGLNVVRGAMSLLGGPIGVATMAIGALIIYWNDVAAAAGNAAAKHEQAAKRIQQAAIKASIPAIKDEIAAAQKLVDEYGKKYDDYIHKGKVNPQATAEHLKRISEATKLRDEAKQALEQAKQKQADEALKSIDQYAGERRDTAAGQQVVKPKVSNALQEYLENGKYQTDSEKLKQALEEEAALFRRGVDGLDQGSAEYQDALQKHYARVAKIKKDHSKGEESAAKKAEREAAKDMEQVQDLIRQSTGLSATYNNKLDALNRLFKAGKISVDQYNQALAQLNRTETDRGKEADKLVKRQKEVLAGLDAQALEQAQVNQREYAGLGRGDRFRKESEALDQISKRAVDAKKRLAEDLDLNLIDPAAYQRALDAIDASTGRMVADQRAHFAAMQQAAGDWSLGASRALENYADHARDVAGQMEQMFSRAFGGMEDALTKFVMTGKLSFTDFANSVIEDLIRIQIRQSMAGLLGGGLNSMMAGMFQTSGPAAPIVAGTLGFSTGGPVFGPGSATSDSIPAMLSNGEFVVRAAAVDHYGLGTLHALNAKKLATGGGVGRASGNAGRYAAPDAPPAPARSAPESIRVELVNKGGQPLQATSAQPRFDGREMVISVVLEDIRRGGPIREAVKNVR
ncbi:hypothetical protein QR66_02460 [Chromobacterium piscinae]|nr:hypothetical protein QR66_02460 [Chromobacterium piscinae]